MFAGCSLKKARLQCTYIVQGAPSLLLPLLSPSPTKGNVASFSQNQGGLEIIRTISAHHTIIADGRFLVLKMSLNTHRRQFSEVLKSNHVLQPYPIQSKEICISENTGRHRTK